MKSESQLIDELLPAAAASPQPCEDQVQYCDGAFKFCKALSSRLGDGYRKGINAANMINFTALRQTSRRRLLSSAPLEQSPFS